MVFDENKKKKIKDSKTTGTSTDDLYVPTLWYYDIMSFITDTEIRRRGTETLENNTDLSEDIPDDVPENVSKKELHFFNALLFCE